MIVISDEYECKVLFFEIYLIDIDECMIVIYNCYGVVYCYNNDGFFICECWEGYNGDGLFCELIGECFIGYLK